MIGFRESKGQGLRLPGILHIITGLETGGAEQSLLRLVSAQRHDGHRLAVVSLRGRGSLTARFEALGIEIESLGMHDGASLSRAIRRLVGLARTWEPCLLQGWMYHGTLAALVAARAVRGRPPVLWNIRQSLYDLGKEKRGTRAAIRLGKALSAMPRRIVYNARLSREQHVAYGFSDAPSVIIPNGFDCNCYRPAAKAPAALREELSIGSHASLIGMVARYHPMKDFAGFLTAAKKLVLRFPDTQFVLVGKGAESGNDELMQLTASAGLQNRVHLLGEREDVVKIMQGLDILSTASAWGEGFPNVVGEAMACGVPCVATDVGDSAYVIADTGLVVPPRDPAALSSAWGNLLSLSQEERRSLGDKARRRVIERFGLQVTINKYRDLYAPYLNTDYPIPR